jgi:hypothetical protein
VIINATHCDDNTCPDCGRWWTGQVGTRLHVVPVNDEHPHTAPICACNPVVEMNVTNDGEHGHMEWLVIHNSWDGREL